MIIRFSLALALGIEPQAVLRKQQQQAAAAEAAVEEPSSLSESEPAL